MSKKRGDGEGSVFKHGVTGKWRAQLPYYVGAKRHFTTKSFDTKGAADAWITSQRHDRYQGVAVAPDKMTIAAYMRSWLEIQKKAVRPKTHRTYSDFVRCHIEPDLGTIKLQDLTTTHVKRWLFSKVGRPEGEKDLSTRSIKHLRDTLRGALNSAVKERLLKVNPVLSVDKLPAPRETAKDLREPMTPAEARKLLELVSKHREGALLRTILTMGLRKGEVLGLHLDDLKLDDDPPTLQVRQSLQAVGGKLQLGPAKTDGSARTLPLNPGLVKILRQYLDRRAAMKAKAETKDRWIETGGYVFVTRHGAPIYPRNLNRDFTKLLADAGLRHFTIHDLRHACATIALADGVPASYIAAMLGHADVKTTMSMYMQKPLAKVLQHATGTIDRMMSANPAGD